MIRAIAVAYNLLTLLSHEVIRKGLLIYWILSFSLNVIVTSLIIGRLFYARMEVRKNLGARYATVYSRVVALIIESTAPYTVISVIFVVLFSLDHPAFMLFVVLYPQIQVSGPLPASTRSIHLFTELVHLFRSNYFACSQAPEGYDSHSS